MAGCDSVEGAAWEGRYYREREQSQMSMQAATFSLVQTTSANFKMGGDTSKEAANAAAEEQKKMEEDEPDEW